MFANYRLRLRRGLRRGREVVQRRVHRVAVKRQRVVVDRLQRRVRVLLQVAVRAALVAWAVQVDRVEEEGLREEICRRCCPGFLQGVWLI